MAIAKGDFSMVTIECPQCHHKNPDDAEFCEQCGAELPVAAQVSSAGAATQVASFGGQNQAQAGADELVCPKCKAPYVPGDVFCFNCGNDLRNLPGNHPAASPAIASQPNGAVANNAAPMATTVNTPPADTGMNEDAWDKAFSNPATASATPAASVGSMVANPMADPAVSEPSTNVTPASSGNDNAFAVPPTPAPTIVNPTQTGAAAGPVSHLTLTVNGPYGVQTVEFVGRELLLGRTDAKTRVFPDVNLDDAAASRRHAAVWLEDQEGQFYVQDLESSNGTSLNGKDLEPGNQLKLTNNDILKIGTRYSIQVHIS